LVHDIEKIGAFAGLASFLGLGVFALLLFAHGRDIRRLRDWAGSAPEAERLLRAAGLDPGARGESLDIAEFARLAASRLSTPPAAPRTI